MTAVGQRVDAVSNYDVRRDRIRQRMQELGLSMSHVDVKAGITRGLLRKFLRGETKEMLDKNLSAIARALDVDPAWLRGETEQAAGANQAPMMSTVRPMSMTQDVPVVGIVEAGAFREVDYFDDLNMGAIVGGFDPEYRNERQFGFDVVGDSMDLAGIGDGDQVVCLDPWEANVAMDTGTLVVVERRSDGGLTRELTVKELHVFADRMELRPRSSNPKHKPFIVDADYDLGDDHELVVVGVVIGIRKRVPVKFNRLESRGSRGRGEGRSGGQSMHHGMGGISSKLLKGALVASLVMAATVPCKAMAVGLRSVNPIASECQAAPSLERLGVNGRDPYNEAKRHLIREVGLCYMGRERIGYDRAKAGMTMTLAERAVAHLCAQDPESA